MPEDDCSDHTVKARVKLDRTELVDGQATDLIAALLRTIADYTDGFCAVRGADDEDLATSSGMAFWFRDEKKKSRFKRRVGIYLRADVQAALTIT